MNLPGYIGRGGRREWRTKSGPTRPLQTARSSRRAACQTMLRSSQGAPGRRRPTAAHLRRPDGPPGGSRLPWHVRRGRRPATPPKERAGPGRPKLGVVSREVSLLPRHWDWLERAAARDLGRVAPARRRSEEARARRGARASHQRGRQPVHVGDGRRPARLRGSLARPVRGRQGALRDADPRLAQRHPRAPRADGPTPGRA